MIEPIATAKAVRELADIAKYLYDYIENVKGAPERTRELREELKYVWLLLNPLRDFLTSKSTNTVQLKSAITEFEEILQQMKARVDESKSQGIERLKWPFKKDENNRLLLTIERYKGIFEIALGLKVTEDTKFLVKDVQNRKRTEILEWLSTDNFATDHHALQKVRADNSGKWFLSSKEFTGWVDGTIPQCLLCYAGAGKSVLMSIAIDDLQERFKNEDIKVVYVYFKYQARKSQTSVALARNLIKQLMPPDGDIPSDLESLYNASKTTDPPSPSDFLKLLRQYRKGFSSIYAVFDAFDECSDENQNDVLSLFADLEKSEYNLLVSGRPQTPSKLRTRLANTCTLELRANICDLKYYVDKRMSEEKISDKILKTKFQNLIKQVDGMFLLAKLQLDYILSFRLLKRQRSAFMTVPRNTHAAYHDVLGRINERPGDQDLAMEILGWIFRAPRNLRMDELLEALSFSCDEVSVENDSGEDPDDDSTKTDGELDINGNRMLEHAQVVECCRGLVLHEESGLVQFSHETVRTFVERELKEKLLPAIDNAKVCVTYLASTQLDNPCVDLDSMEKRTQKYKFSLYAAQFWGFHIRDEAEKDPDIQRAVLSLLASETKRNSMLQLETYANSSRGDISFTKGRTLLHVIAKKGLARICAHLLLARMNVDDTIGDLSQISKLPDRQTNVATWDDDGRTALHLAAMEGHKDVVALLLDSMENASIIAEDRNGRTALHEAAMEGHKDVVVRLLDRMEDASIAAKDRNGRTALHWAAYAGHRDVIESLLREGINVVAAQDTGKQTALHLAAWRGHKDVVKLLLEKGAEVDVREGLGWTALNQAKLRGHKDVVTLFLDKGAGAVEQNEEGWTALHEAAVEGHKDLVTLLLDEGADVAAKTEYGSTALDRAAAYGHKDVVELLLREGADIATLDDRGQTSLHWAAWGGHEDAVELLLDRGADIDARDTVLALGWTALHRAAYGGHEGVVALLLYKGADVGVKDGLQRTALDLAMYGGHKKVVELLEEAVEDHGKCKGPWI